MIIVNSQEGEGELVGMSPHIHIERHLDLQIKTLENAKRNADKLERLLESKRRQKEDNF
jgi:flagellar basal body rod protein FlgF